MRGHKGRYVIYHVYVWLFDYNLTIEITAHGYEQ